MVTRKVPETEVVIDDFIRNLTATLTAEIRLECLYNYYCNLTGKFALGHAKLSQSETVHPQVLLAATPR